MTAYVSMLLKSCSSLTCFRACFRPGRAKDLSAPGIIDKHISFTSCCFSVAFGIEICALNTSLKPCTVVHMRTHFFQLVERVNVYSVPDVSEKRISFISKL